MYDPSWTHKDWKMWSSGVLRRKWNGLLHTKHHLCHSEHWREEKRCVAGEEASMLEVFEYFSRGLRKCGALEVCTVWGWLWYRKDVVRDRSWEWKSDKLAYNEVWSQIMKSLPNPLWRYFQLWPVYYGKQWKYLRIIIFTHYKIQSVYSRKYRLKWERPEGESH